jgi:hypothetical protein
LDGTVTSKDPPMSNTACLQFRKLSDPQRRMLEDLRDHGDTHWRISGRSSYGGALGTLQSLVDHKLVVPDMTKVSVAGTEALAAGNFVVGGPASFEEEPAEGMRP